jgi:hypothetical protein
MRLFALALVCLMASPAALALDFTLLSTIAAKIRVIVNQSNQPKNDALLHVGGSGRGDRCGARRDLRRGHVAAARMPRLCAPRARACRPPQTAYARLAFHDCTGPGGCDGCINLNLGENNGLGGPIAVLEGFYNGTYMRWALLGVK